jgi:glycosyltransferase involved in cell wall biosynthesis
VNAPERAEALAVQPISEPYLDLVSTALGVRPRVTVLSELRRDRLTAILGALRSLDAPVGLALIEEPSAAPLLPVLAFLLGLTRCGSLATVDARGVPRAISKASALASGGLVAWGTLAGAWAALVCGVDLWRLGARRRLSVRRVPPARLAYLKTNLWFGLKAGGSVGHVAGVVNALSRHGVDVHVFAVDRPPLLDAGIASYDVPNDTAYGYPYELNYYTYHRRFVAVVGRALASRPPDAIYHRLSVANYSGLTLARRLSVPLILEYNGSEVWVARHWGRPLRFERLARRAERMALEQADLIVVVSDVLADELEQQGIPADRILVQPNSVDPDMFDPSRFDAERTEGLRRSLGIAGQAVVCGFIGTFGAWHGVVTLAEVIAKLIAEDPEWVERSRVHFLLVGDGQLMPAVRERLARPAVARHVTLTGLVPQADAPQYLAACDVLVSPHVPNPDGSRFFGSPTKLFEYMAMARGIVASDLGQIGQVLAPARRLSDAPSIEGSSSDAVALLVSPGDQDELAGGLRLLVDRPRLRMRMGENARRRALDRYTWARNVDHVLKRLTRPGD